MSYRYRRYRKAQLNAISRSYTAKYRKEALAGLTEIGVDFDAYCRAFGYKGSPCKLLTDINAGAKKTLANVEALRKEVA